MLLLAVLACGGEPGGVPLAQRIPGKWNVQMGSLYAAGIWTLTAPPGDFLNGSGTLHIPPDQLSGALSGHIFTDTFNIKFEPTDGLDEPMYVTDLYFSSPDRMEGIAFGRGANGLRFIADRMP